MNRQRPAATTRNGSTGARSVHCTGKVDQPTRRIQHVDEVLPPVAASLHKLEGLTEPRMERMGHPDLGSPRILGIKRT